MNTEKSWFALEITVASEASEAVEFALNELDALGTEINNLGVKQSEILSVVGYFNEPPEDEAVQINLNEALRIYGFTPEVIQKKDWRKVENTDWLIEWKKHWKPTETAKFIIAPSWENVENSDKIVVRIEPNMAFGTGTHETTRLCLKAIEENYQDGMSFLDVGTGTGILSIAAAKFKVQDSRFKVQDSRSVTLNLEPETLNLEPETLNSFQAYDTDFDSITIAKENAELNGVGDKIDFYVGSISEETPTADFVCANITIDIIAPILSLLIAKSERVLILSGILNEQKSIIQDELKQRRIENFRIESLGEWLSVTIEID